jgi:hypothetical protein
VHKLRVVGTQDTYSRSLFGIRDTVVINAGARDGIAIDQQYFIRRPFVFGHVSKGKLATTHTSGWLRVVTVNEKTAIGRIEQACDGVIAGDYLEPFVAPSAPSFASRPGDTTFAALDFSSVGRVIYGDEQRRLGSTGDFMMVNHADGPLASGTRVAIYRDLHTDGIPLTAIGEGVIVAVGDSQLLRVTAQRDAIQGGDYVVPRK